MQLIWVDARKIIEKLLHHRGVQPRKFHEMTRTGGGFDRPKDPRIFKAMLMHADRLCPTPGDAPTMDGMEAKPALVAGPHPDRPLIIGRNGRTDLIGKASLKLPYGVRVFLGFVGRGTFGLAPSLYRTSLWTALSVIVVPNVVLIQTRIAS